MGPMTTVLLALKFMLKMRSVSNNQCKLLLLKAKIHHLPISHIFGARKMMGLRERRRDGIISGFLLSNV